MKTLYKLAKEIGVAYPTLFKRFKNSTLYGIVDKDETGKLLMNAETEGIIRDWYTKPLINPTTILGNEVNPLGNVNLSIENEELKKKNHELETRVRELTDVIMKNSKTSQTFSLSVLYF